MDAGSYLHWLRTTKLEIAQLDDLKEAVSVILEALRAEEADAEDLMLVSLLEIEQELHSGYTPTELIESFRSEFVEEHSAEEPAVLLETELREIAAGIGPEQWSTESYQDFSKAVNGFLDDGDEDPLWDFLDKMDEVLERSKERYCSTDILPKEVTAESAVAHKILMDGIAHWEESILIIRDGDPDWDEVLGYAEMGNRLLITVQVFNQRLQGAVKSE